MGIIRPGLNQPYTRAHVQPQPNGLACSNHVPGAPAAYWPIRVRTFSGDLTSTVERWSTTSSKRSLERLRRSTLLYLLFGPLALRAPQSDATRSKTVHLPVGKPAGQVSRSDGACSRSPKSRVQQTARPLRDQASGFAIYHTRGPVPVSPFVGAGRLPFWVDLIFKSAFQKKSCLSHGEWIARRRLSGRPSAIDGQLTESALQLPLGPANSKVEF